jgi:hypothetical protein
MGCYDQYALVALLEMALKKKKMVKKRNCIVSLVIWLISRI